jgi:tetratricopeptide (TPR) repeat protein
MTSHREDDVSKLLSPLDGRPGPARRISSAQARALVEAALDAAADSIDAAPAAATPRRAFGRGWQMVAAAAACLLLVGAASAGIYRFARTAPAVEPVPEPENRPSTRQPAAPAEPEPEPAFEIVVELGDDWRAEPEEPADDLREPRRRPGPTEAKPRTPDDLLQLANEHRRDRRWRQAERTYARVMREHAQTSAAYVAAVASASIRLEKLGDPRGALRLYRRALRDEPRGPLSEEARFGMAEAHRALGDHAAEAAALRELLARHPDSPLRPRAEARLRGLAEEAE